MKRLQRAALLTELVEQMHEHESWCGETHLQKATFFLQELLGVELGYDFVVYKHGPFSFDLRDELGGFVSDKLIRYQPQVPPYGPRITVTAEGAGVQEMYPKTVARHADKIAFVATKLDARGVIDLERLATALYVTLDAPDGSAEQRARMLCELKPHIPEPAALTAVRDVDEIRAEAEAIAA
jgi:hypothetical protein